MAMFLDPLGKTFSTEKAALGAASVSLHIVRKRTNFHGKFCGPHTVFPMNLVGYLRSPLCAVAMNFCTMKYALLAQTLAKAK